MSDLQAETEVKRQPRPLLAVPVQRLQTLLAQTADQNPLLNQQICRPQ